MSVAFTKGLTARGRLLRTTLLGTTALVALGLVLAPSPSRADTTWTGANSTDWFDPANWSNGVPITSDVARIDTDTPHATVVGSAGAQARVTYVGETGTGSLTIQNGGAFGNTFGFIGYDTGSTGAATVNGAGSSWTNIGNLQVGTSGTGTLTIQNGASVSNYIGYLGFNFGSVGTATVDGAGSSWTNANDFHVGYGGTGTLTVQNGGTVSNATGLIGSTSDGAGAVTVDGAGSSWTSASTLYVGYLGAGTLTIRDGGTVRTTVGLIGSAANSVSTVTVDGAGSSFINAANLYAGYGGAGTLTIQNGGTVSSLSGVIGFQANATGTVTVDGAGSTWTNLGDLFVGNLGTALLTIQNGSSVSNAVGYVGYNAGSTGTVTVDGAGSSWINIGEIVVGNLGTALVTIQNGGTLSNNRGHVAASAGSTGTVTVDGTGSSWTSAGALYLGESGTGALTVRNGGTVNSLFSYVGFNTGSTGTATVDGAGSSWTTFHQIVGHSGTGALAIRNGGAVSSGGFAILGDQVGSTGTATVDGAGSAWTHDGSFYVGYAGDGVLTIQNGGAVSPVYIVLGVLSGSTGTLNIGSASGQAAVAPGTLNTRSVAFGAGTGKIVFNHTAANYAFNPNISGDGTVRVEAGTTNLTGNNLYTGATTVDGGTLIVNGSIASSALTTVNAGGTLGGTGTVGATTIASGATLAPGNSIGTLTVQGNLTFNAGATYSVEVSPTAADRTNVNGTATLTGATVNAVGLPSSFRSQTYTILNATGGFGGTQFAGLTGSFAPGARNPHLTYDLNNVFLVLDPGTIQLPAGIGGNQSSAAGGINSAVENGGTPPAGFDVLLNMSGAQLINALGQMSGQPGASTAQAGFAATGQFISGVFDSAFGDGEGQGGALGYAQAPKISREAKDAYAAVTPRDRIATFDARWNVWASVYGGNNRVAGDATAGTSTTTSRTFGTAVGASYRFTPDTQAGFALGGAGSSFSLDGGFGGGKADIFNAAIYARHNFGAAYMAALLGYSWQDTTTDRNVLGEQLHASFKAQALSARLEGGSRYATPSLGITPYTALQTTTFYLPAYGETATSGPGIFALNYESKTITATRGELGAKFDKAMLVQGGIFTLKAKTAWAHDWNTDRAATAVFQTLPGSTFTTNGAQPSANAALLSLGGEMKWHNGWSLAGGVDGEFSRTTASYAGKGTVRYAW